MAQCWRVVASPRKAGGEDNLDITRPCTQYEHERRFVHIIVALRAATDMPLLACLGVYWLADKRRGDKLYITWQRQAYRQIGGLVAETHLRPDWVARKSRRRGIYLFLRQVGPARLSRRR